MSGVETFIWGFAGSVAVEIVTLYNLFDSDASALPERYGKFFFWVVRFLLALIAGGLAVAYEIKQPLLAANIGAATPLIVKTLAAKIPTS